MRHLFFGSLLAGLLIAAGPAWAGGIAIVLNSGDASISLLDMTHGTEIRRVPVLREPHHVALAPGGREMTAIVSDTKFLSDGRLAEAGPGSGKNARDGTCRGPCS